MTGPARPKEEMPLSTNTGRRHGTKEGTAIPDRFEPRFWEHADQRYNIVQAIRARVERLKAETSADSYAKQVLCERAIFLLCVLETREIEACESGRIDLGIWIQGVNSLAGLLAKLGLDLKSVQTTSAADRLRASMEARQRAEAGG